MAIPRLDPTALIGQWLAGLAVDGRGVALLLREGGLLCHAVSHGLPDSFTAQLRVPVSVEAGANGCAAASGRTVVVQDTRVHPNTIRYSDILTSHRLFSIISVPVFGPDRDPIATLALYGRAPGTATPAEVAALQAVAQRVAGILAA